MVSISQDRFLLKILQRNASVLPILTVLSDWPWVGFLQEQSSLAWPTAIKSSCQRCSSPETSVVQLVRLCQIRHFFWNLLLLLFFSLPPGKTDYLLHLLLGKWKFLSVCQNQTSVALPSITWDLHGCSSPISAQPLGFESLLPELQGSLIPNSSPSSLDLPCHYGHLVLKMFITENGMLLLETF